MSMIPAQIDTIAKKTKANAATYYPQDNAT